MEAAADAIGTVRTLRLAHICLNNETVGKEIADETLYERILPANEQRREHGVVVIPTPACTELVGILHRLVCIDVATYGVDSHLVYSLYKGTHIVGVEAWVEAAHAVDIARKRAVVHLAGVAQLGLELVAAAQAVDGCYRRDEFHRRRRAQKLTRVVTVEHRVGIEVVHHHSDSGCLKHVVLKQVVQMLCHGDIPGQCLLRHLKGVGHERVGNCRTVVFVKLDICLCRYS